MNVYVLTSRQAWALLRRADYPSLHIYLATGFAHNAVMESIIADNQTILVPSQWPVWTGLILFGGIMQALSLLPWVQEKAFSHTLQVMLVLFGGMIVLFAAAKDHDHLVLVGQIVAWVFLWRGIIQGRAKSGGSHKAGNP